MAETRSDCRRRVSNTPASFVSCRVGPVPRPGLRPGRSADAAARAQAFCFLSIHPALFFLLALFWCVPQSVSLAQGVDLSARSLGSRSADGSAQLAREGWRFEPLGPEGADVAQLHPLRESHWALRTTDGQLYLWSPPGPAFGTGHWQRVAMQASGASSRVRLLGSRADGALAVLCADGSIWSLDAVRRGATGGSPNPAEAHETSLPGAAAAGDAGAGPPALRRDTTDSAADSDRGVWHDPRSPQRISQIPLEDAMTGVALLPYGEPGGTGVLLVTRRGVIHAIEAARRESWQADFLLGGVRPVPGPQPGIPPNLAIRSAFWSSSSRGGNRRDGGCLFALTEWEGLFASADGGHTYRPVVGGLPKTVAAVAVLGDGAAGLMAVAPDAYLRSHDDGRSWLRAMVSQSARHFDEFVQLLSIDPAGGRLLAVTRGGELLHSADDGSSWTLQLGDCPLHVRVLARGGGEILAATSRGVLSSRDGGASWGWRNQGLRRVSVLVMHAPADGSDGLLIGTEMGAYVSAVVGDVWQPAVVQSCRYPRRESLRRQRPAPARDPLFGPGLAQQPIVREILRAPIAAIHTLGLIDGRRLVAIGGDQGAGLLLPSADGAQPPVWRTLLPSRAVASLLLTPAGRLWGAGTDRDGLWLAEVSLETGEVREPQLPGHGAVMGARATPHLVEVPDDWGRPQVWLLADQLLRVDGDSPEPMTLPPNRTPLALAVDGAERWLGTDAGVFRSARGGDWRAAGLAEERVVELLAHPSGALFARTPDGVHWRCRDAEAWEEVPIPCALRLLSMAVLPDGRLLLGTADFGVFAVEIPIPSPAAPLLLLVDASPNPFKGSVVLRCTLPPELLAGAATVPNAASPSGAVTAPPGPSGTGGRVGASSIADSGPGTLTTGSEFPDGVGAQDVGASGSLDAPALPSLGAVLARTQEAEISIYTVHGQLVRRLRGAQYVSDPSGHAALQWSWDGRTEQGLPVPSGMYVVATSIGSQKFAGKIIKLR